MFVVYHKETTKLLRLMKHGYWQDADMFEREQDAKSCITREAKKGKINAADYAIAERREFFKSIEKTEVRHGVGPGRGTSHTVGVNTSWTVGPWSETYWCS